MTATAKPTDIILTALLVLSRTNIHKNLHKKVIQYLYETKTEGFAKYQTINGIKHGLCRRLYPNGQLWYEENYQNGQKHGLCRGWYENGQLSYEANYQNGQKIELKI